VVLPDVNVLIYAFRRESPFHALCHGWLERTIASDTSFGMSPLILAAVARITTNPRTFTRPSTLDEVFAYCDGLMSQPNCRLIEPGPRHWGIFERLCMATNTTAGDITDVWYAALAIEHGCEWVSLDKDFSAFPGLSWSRPTAD
jgi:hypothetical protein